MPRRTFAAIGAMLLSLSIGVAVFVWLFRVSAPAPSRERPAPASLAPLPSEGIGEMLSRFIFAPWGPPAVVPIAVVIENHEDARPHQRGLEKVIFIAEFLVEGYISRFIAFFERGDLPEQIGPVRSLRPYFLSVVHPWASALLFAGGSPEALQALEGSPVPWVNLLGVDDTYFRDHAVPPPHNMFLRPAQVRSFFAGRRLTPIPWPPFPSGEPRYGSGASRIRLQFFSPLHNAEYRYDLLDGTYTRTTGRVTHTAHPRNVLILAMPIAAEGAYGRLDIHPQGTGPAFLFSSGFVQEGRWERAAGPNDAFHFWDLQGQPLGFAPGLTWMTVLPTLERVQWSSGDTSGGEWVP